MEVHDGSSCRGHVEMRSRGASKFVLSVKVGEHVDTCLLARSSVAFVILGATAHGRRTFDLEIGNTRIVTGRSVHAHHTPIRTCNLCLEIEWLAT